MDTTYIAQKGKICGLILLGNNIIAINKFLWRSRWLGAAPTHASHMGGTTGASLLINKAPTVTAASRAHTHAISMAAVKVSAAGGCIGAAVATLVEWGFIWSLWYKDNISGKQALTMGGGALIANGLSAASFVGCMTVGAIVGAPGGPVGSVIGAIIGAVVASFATRAAINKASELLFKKKHETRTKFEREALFFFFHDEKYDISDTDKFNKDTIQRRYHQLAAITHPDAKNGNYTEWLQLSAHYGVLTAICEAQNNKCIDTNDNLTIGEQSKILNAVVARQIEEENNMDIMTVSNTADTLSSSTYHVTSESSGYEYSHRSETDTLLGINDNDEIVK